jgi:AcrR family transcriptional regulator
VTTTSKPLASRRSETSRLAILDAALALCREQGYARVTIEAIAARAGVGKQTIYRWWPSKGAVVLDAFERVAAEIPVPDTGDVLADMRTFLTGVVTLFTDDNFGPHLGALIGEAQHDPAVRTALLEQYLKPRRAAVADRLRLAQQHRQLPGELDLTAVLEVMFGALYHRLLLRNGPLDQAYAHFVADTVLGGCSAQPITDRSHHPVTQRQ